MSGDSSSIFVQLLRAQTADFTFSGPKVSGFFPFWSVCAGAMSLKQFASISRQICSATPFKWSAERVRQLTSYSVRPVLPTVADMLALTVSDMLASATGDHAHLAGKNRTLFRMKQSCGVIPWGSVAPRLPRLTQRPVRTMF